MQLLADRGIATEPYTGFMEDPKMGAVAWGLPRKTAADLGPMDGQIRWGDAVSVYRCRPSRNSNASARAYAPWCGGRGFHLFDRPR